MNASVENRPGRSRILFWILGGLLLIGLIAALIVLLTEFFPKQGCNPPTLVLGADQYIIKTIQPESDGSLKVPANRDDSAFWVEGTDTNEVFALSPTENNLALESSLKSGDKATVTWTNCNSTTYILSEPRTGVPDNAALLDQSTSQITIFVQPGPTATGFVVRGELAEQTIQSFSTPNPSEIQAEISLLDVAASADGKTITVGISIMNYGQSTITLSASDVSLTSVNDTSVAPDISEPSLPKEIQPGITETIYFTFARPSSATATLKIFNAEYELEDY